MSFFGRWQNWRFGDVLYGPDMPTSTISQFEFLRIVAVNFRVVSIDWLLGDEWADARIKKNVEIGLSGSLLDAEYSLLGHSVLVGVGDNCSTQTIEFVVTSNTEAIDLYYPQNVDISHCRQIADKLAKVLGYELTLDE